MLVAFCSVLSRSIKGSDLTEFEAAQAPLLLSTLHATEE